jgi:hypothetical protein
VLACGDAIRDGRIESIAALVSIRTPMNTKLPTAQGRIAIDRLKA